MVKSDKSCQIFEKDVNFAEVLAKIVFNNSVQLNTAVSTNVNIFWKQVIRVNQE